MTNPKVLQRALLVSPEKHSRDPAGAAGDMAVTQGIGCPKKSHMHLPPLLPLSPEPLVTFTCFLCP